ncbi:MORN repeat protein [Fusobacterium animalis ATCC 51191]|uniref:MORN repeat protein n=2 Tax=Fusobacterium animalis TaxID=76859 RepID=F9ELW9_9FUSO|nr:MORN repeat protein [Fusobacterium animalis ATCC 51191]
MKDKIAYKEGSNTPFTGVFGVVIDDKIESYEEYKNGLLDGETAYFAKGKQVKLLSEMYTKGKLNGQQKSYYENGKLKSIVYYSNDRINGIESYDRSGKLLHKSIFENGTGDWKFYWSNGKVSEEGKYKSWRKDGVWKKYREDGSLDTVIKYDNGRLLSEKWQ